MYAISMKCLECGGEYGLEEAISSCPECGGLLDINYDYEKIKRSISKQEVSRRNVFSIWRYADFLPINPSEAVTLGEGFTPLVKAEGLSQLLGLKSLYLKLDFTCPTGSFKDRGSSVMISKAKQLNSRAVAVDSSGNAASSIAGYSAKAGLRCYVFAPSYASMAKLIQSLAYGATVFAVEGTRGETYETAKAAYKRFQWYYCGFQTNPYAVEGLKTIAYELCEFLKWNPPDKIIFPVGSSSNLVGCWKGLKELYDLGWITRMPSLVCVQSEGCAPIARAYRAGYKEITSVEKPKSIAEGLMISHPIKGGITLKILSETDGLAEIVTDEEILEASKALARLEGMFVEPSAAVSVAGVKKLVDSGSISKNETVICILTGTGLKTRDVFESVVGRAIAIKPGLKDVETIVLNQF